MNAKYYLLGKRKQRKGPYTGSQLKELWAAGKIPKGTLCCLKGAKAWQPIESLRELHGGATEGESPGFLERFTANPRKLAQAGGVVVLILFVCLGLSVLLGTKKTPASSESDTLSNAEPDDQPQAEIDGDGDSDEMGKGNNSQGAQPGMITDPGNEKQITKAVGLVVIAWEVTHQSGEMEEYISLPCYYSRSEYLIMSPSTQKNLTRRTIGGKPMYVEHLLGGTGSCFLVTSNGYAITNKHVVEDYDMVKRATSKLEKIKRGMNFEKITPVILVFFGGKEHRARLVHISPEFDHAILKMDTISNAPFFALSGSDEIKRGKKVVTLGFPGAARDQVLSSKEKALDEARKRTYKKIKGFFSKDAFSYDHNEGTISKPSDRPVGRLIQHNSIINHGNSGGPLVDASNCHVLGINTFGISGGGVQGIFFSVQMKQLKSEIGTITSGTTWQ